MARLYGQTNHTTPPPYFHLFETLSNPLNRRRSFGVNSILNSSIPFAVKTGTTKNFHDNWAFGYHPDLVVASWVGNNDNTPMIDVDGITGAGPIWHHMVEAAIAEGYVSQGPNSNIQIPNPLIKTQKCFNQSCSRSEIVYQNPEQEWLSDLEAGQYCLEDFFIQDIDAAEISKIAKLFDFKDFSLEWCAQQQLSLRGDGGIKKEGDAAISGQLQILKPQDGETFYIRQDIPLELQEIILKANQEVEWYVTSLDEKGLPRENEENRGVGYGEFIFIQPVIGEHEITAKSEQTESTIQIEVYGVE